MRFFAVTERIKKDSEDRPEKTRNLIAPLAQPSLQPSWGDRFDSVERPTSVSNSLLKTFQEGHVKIHHSLMVAD